jgi:flagellum-specific peptidoglycan hydrolase FlgJ
LSNNGLEAKPRMEIVEARPRMEIVRDKNAVGPAMAQLNSAMDKFNVSSNSIAGKAKDFYVGEWKDGIISLSDVATKISEAIKLGRIPEQEPNSGSIDTTNPPAVATSNTAKKGTMFKTNNEFIDKISPGALLGYQQGGILPSLTMAQAILESGWGKSSIGNNIFGIKAGDNWKGLKQFVGTNEEINGVMQKQQAWFRDYATIDESILDHTKILQNSRYSAVKLAKDYKEAAWAVSKAGYATDSTYAPQLIDIIEQNNLSRFDKSYATGGIIDNPQIARMGEQAPNFPEYVIPTNPVYRNRAADLIKRAAGDVGVSVGETVGGLTVNVDTDSGEVVSNLQTITGKLEELIGVMRGGKPTFMPERRASVASTNVRNYI